MKVELNRVQLQRARTEMRRLADAVTEGVPQSNRASPIALPSLDGLSAKAEWMNEQLPMLTDLAAVAMLLDADGDGHVTVNVPGDTWDPAETVREAGDTRFGPGFVEATGLAGEELASLLLTLGSVGQKSPPGSVMTPQELRAFIIDHPKVAEALQNTRPMYGEGPAGTLRSLTGSFITAAGEAAAVYEQRRIGARDLFEGLSPADAAILAMTYPSLVGNMPGVPFKNRADANTVNVVAALADERRELEEMRDEHEKHQNDWDLLGRNNNDLDGSIEELEKRIKLYESILNDNRTIIYFDASGDGAIAELHGKIDKHTRNAGVLVPGTGADLAGFEGVARRSRSFHEHDPTGNLAMISWLGGDLPDGMLDAPDPKYSKDLAPRLVDFSRDLRLEIERAGAKNTRVTYGGHSYGGAVVGRSELHGLDADRVMHIESAGMGHDVRDGSDLPRSQRNVDRYSMTAPGDFIELTQGFQKGDIGHGADPDDFGGTTRLHTGNKTDGEPNTGFDAHSGVFQAGSDSWDNMYAVYIGGEVETYRSPNYETISTGRGAVTYQDGWKDDGEKVNIP